MSIKQKVVMVTISIEMDEKVSAKGVEQDIIAFLNEFPYLQVRWIRSENNN